MLRLVDRDEGRNTPARRRHRPAASLSLTDDEARHVRAAIRGASRTFGSLTKLAGVLGVKPGTLTRRCRRPSGGLAIAVARVAGLSVDAMLSGKLAAVPSSATAPDAPKDGAW